MEQEPGDPAPALTRGIAVMRALQGASQGLTLDAVAEATKAPKSSLLRVLRSLELAGWVCRAQDRRYRSLVEVRPVDPAAGLSWATVLEDALQQLGHRLGLTVEWYEPEGAALVIRWRRENAVGSVQVKAQLGFVRDALGEMDAVARHLVAFGGVAPGPEAWRYERGQRSSLGARQRTALANAADPVNQDNEYNSNGIRRLAAAVRQGDGSLVGVIALPEAYTPDADRRREERIVALTETLNQLQAYREQQDV
jgi:DNA-binding IclR family transcriptional regulator